MSDPTPIPTEAEKLAKAWDKAMCRAFKGLVLGGRPAARAQLMRSAEANEDE